MREVLRTGGLARSLRHLPAQDRLAAAWLVVCGKALADRSCVVEYKDAQVTVEVLDGAWLEELRVMKEQLKLELTRIARVPVAELHLVVKR
ncbi:DciA family protein [Edaphobacter sp. HDX4]|uniref:DciA family protein n=1 Tax=Edaphobacter sp. HDX4 TaxID=2794064 RepID=UPI002FE5C075